MSALLEEFYAKRKTPDDKMRIPLASFLENPKESFLKAEKYLEEEGVVFITYAFEQDLVSVLEKRLVDCIKRMDPEGNADIKHMKDVVCQNPSKGVWSNPRAGSFVLAQQNDDEHLDRLPLDITGNGENDMGVSMVYNPIYTHIILWTLEHRKDLAAILLKLTYPNGIVDRDTCTWVDKSSQNKFSMMKPTYDVYECDRYRAMLVYEDGRQLMFLPKSHTSAFPNGRNQKKRKRTVLPFMKNTLTAKEAFPFAVGAPPISEANQTGTLVIFKDVVYFEQGQLRSKNSHVFRIHMGVHDASRLTEKDRLTVAMAAASRDFTPTITGNNVTMSTVAKGFKFAPYTPPFDGKRQLKYRKVDEKQSATFRQCKRAITLQRTTLQEQFNKIRPLTRHLMGDTHNDPFKEATPTIRNMWQVNL